MKTWAPLVLVLFPALAAGAEIYKWIDERGRAHFSQQPPRGRPFEKLEVKTLPPTPNPGVQSLSDYAESLRGSPAPAQPDAGAPAGAAAPAPTAPARDPQRCQIAESRLAQLRDNPLDKLVLPDGAGGVRPMTGSEHSAEVSRMRKLAAENCAAG